MLINKSNVYFQLTSGNPAAINKCLTDNKGGAYVVAAVLKDGDRQLTKFNAPRREDTLEEFKSYSPEEHWALVVDTYKKGFGKMKQQFWERVEQGDRSPMKAGPGMQMIYNRGTIDYLLHKDKNYKLRR